MADISSTAGAETQSSTRLKALDLIRGVAILGILPVNMAFFSGPGFEPEPGADSWHNRLASVLVMLVFEGKMVTLLCLIFGAGIALQAGHAQAAGRRFAPYYARRMLVLFLIGLAHALLLSHLDILTSYAVAGLMTLLFVRRPERSLLRIAGAFLAWCYGSILVVILIAILAGGIEGQDGVPQPAESAAAEQPVEQPDDVENWIENLFTRDNEIRVFRHGSLGELVIHRAIYLGMAIVFFWLESGWYMLASILIGACLLRRAIFRPQAGRGVTAEPLSIPPLLKFQKWIAFGITCGLLCHAAAIIAYLRSPDGWLYFCFLAFGALPLALAYLFLLSFWAQTERFQWLQSRLRAVGRLALSNYLLQSLMCGLIFSGYGLGLYGQLERVPTIGIALALWIMQIFLSHWWSKHFQVGPAEWLWRRLTEGRRYVPPQTA